MSSTAPATRTMSNRVGRRIAQLRRKQASGIQSQTRFAQRIGISASYLTKIERGVKDIPLGILDRAARELGVTSIDLLRESQGLLGLDEVQVPLMKLLGRLRQRPEGIPTLVRFLDQLNAMVECG